MFTALFKSLIAQWTTCVRVLHYGTGTKTTVFRNDVVFRVPFRITVEHHVWGRFLGGTVSVFVADPQVMFLSRGHDVVYARRHGLNRKSSRIVQFP